MGSIFEFIQGKSTSKAMTVFGVLTILAAAVSIVIPMVDGDPLTGPDWKAAGAMVAVGITAIMGKGAASTGGTVPETPEAVKRVNGG